MKPIIACLCTSLCWATVACDSDEAREDELGSDADSDADTDADTDSDADTDTDTDTDTDSDEPDTDWADEPSGVRGYATYSGTSPDSDVQIWTSSIATGDETGSTTSDASGHYEIDLSPGVYHVNAWYLSSYFDCAGGESPVVISAGLWVELDLHLDCADLDK